MTTDTNDVQDVKVAALAKAFFAIMDAREKYGIRLMQDIPDEDERKRVREIINRSVTVITETEAA